MRYIYMFIFSVMLTAAAIQAKSMKSSDYFESGPQRSLADASAKGAVKEIQRILSAGAQINFQGQEGMTALLWAFLQQNKKGYQCLLEQGADPNLQMTKSALTSDGVTDGNSATSLAAMHEDPWYLELALKHGGNPNIVNPFKAVTPVFQCIMFLERSRPRTRLEQLKLLINAGADLNFRNRSDITPMMYAVRLNRYDMVYLMLEAGADPTLKTKWGTTIVYEIKESQTDPKSELYQWRLKVIEFLKAKGIEIN